MCGIAGIVGGLPTRERLAAMAEAQRHRGPDDDGFHLGDGVGLAFRRLAILDIAGGRQPMANEDGAVVVVFNGEIYNHLALRAELLAAGHRFATDHSDTEVLVHGWEQWGEALFPRLNGMFAVGIWDARARELTLARDRYGIKPLYHARLGDGGLAFASEIRSLHASGLVRAAPSPAGIAEYFSFQNLWGSGTMFAGVEQVLPGETLRWKDGATRRTRYWSPSYPRRQPREGLIERHREALRRAVRSQLAADVPVVTYLSGGIDSTAIAACARETSREITAYSCVFDLEGVGADRVVDERGYSRTAAEALGIRRVEHQLARDALIGVIGDYVGAIEDLRMGMGYPNYLIAQRVARDAKAVLSGTGGDEYHAGYLWRFQALGLFAGGGGWRARLRRMAKRLLGRGGEGERERRFRAMLNFLVPAARVDEAFTPEFRRAAGFDADDALSALIARCPSADWRDRILFADATTYLPGLLVLEDKVSMAHSLEARVPLLDNDLVDLLLDSPFDELCTSDTGKRLFRESVRPLVPEAIYAKPKMGFGPPDASWYRGPLRPWIESRLSRERVERRGVLRHGWVRATLERHFSGLRDETHAIWSLLCFDAWCEHFGFHT